MEHLYQRWSLSILMVLLLLTSSATCDNVLKCLVCRKVVYEIDRAIQKADPKKKVQIGSFRIQADGSQSRSEIPYMRSEIHMQDLLEDVCESMEDYVQATFKDTNERTLVKLVSEGGMNPDISRVNITPDEDLNKMVKYYCENMVGDHEDHIIKVFKNSIKDPEYEVCTVSAELCHDMSEEEANAEPEKEEL